MRAGLRGRRPSVEFACLARHGKAVIRLHGAKHAKPAPPAEPRALRPLCLHRRANWEVPLPTTRCGVDPQSLVRQTTMGGELWVKDLDFRAHCRDLPAGPTIIRKCTQPVPAK